MRDYLDDESFAEVVRDYVIALEKRIADIRALKSNAELRSACHDLIGISGTLGMTELMLTSEYWADLARRNNYSTALVFDHLEEVANRALSALRLCIANVDC